MQTRELLGAKVEIGDADFELSDPVIDDELPGGAGQLLAERRRAILRVADVGTFAIADGRQVVVRPDPGVADEAVTVWLHGTVAALVLGQRSRVALHASVIAIDGVGVAVAGARGTGKSTTALRLAQRGHALVTDDVSPLEIGSDIVVHPFGRPVHVHPPTAAALALDVSHARPLLPGLAKVALAGPAHPPAPLDAIAVLEVEDAANGRPERITGAAAHWRIVGNLYRADILCRLYGAEIFAAAAAVAAHVPVTIVRRRPLDWTVDEITDAVEVIAAGACAARC